VRAVGEEEADEGMGAALEAAAVVASARGIGEPPAAGAGRAPSQGQSRRGSLRMDAAPAGNWSAATDSASSTSNAVWSPAERQRFAARGGVSAAIASAASAQSSSSYSPDEALDVSEDALLALFGQNRTAVLRMSGMQIQKESEKEWKIRCAQAKAYESPGRRVPSGFITPQRFYAFQFNRGLLLAASPLKVHDAEQWAWMYARWAIAGARNMSKDSEFTQFLAKADVISIPWPVT
jgi:hypothetical protein